MASQDRQRKPAAPSPAPASLGKILGTVAIAIGAGVFGYYALDGHRHTCEACGHQWRHLGMLNLGDPKAHTCAQCGTVQWWKDGEQHVFRSALREPPPKVIPDAVLTRLQGIRETPRLASSVSNALTKVFR